MGRNYTTEYQVQLVRSGTVGTSVGNLAIEWETSPRDASQYQDFVQDSGVVYFYEGINTREITVDIVDDDDFEYPNERFLVQITSIKYDAVPTNVVAFTNNITSIYVMDDGDFGTIDFLLQTDDSTGVRMEGNTEWVSFLDFIFIFTNKKLQKPGR